VRKKITNFAEKPCQVFCENIFLKVYLVILIKRDYPTIVTGYVYLVILIKRDYPTIVTGYD